MTHRCAGFLLLLAWGCSPEGTPPGPRPDAGPSGVRDTDGDTISDGDEGATGADTDADGTPDYMDLDSDGDRIDDASEAGDSNPASPPYDTDSDGLADFRDPDSDDNGLPDIFEGADDPDGDMLPNYRDLDDDGDFVQDRDEIGDPASPFDSDGDSIPDFRDYDSDNDNILDGDERGIDTDEDGLPDGRDMDSDGDGIRDRDEAGDVDVRTPPHDSDGDLVPDFRDLDSDDDGLADDLEVAPSSGAPPTSPTRPDTDGDGVSDLIEVAAGTDPTDGLDTPMSRGQFVFIVPYEMPTTPPEDTLEFETALQFADVYFSIDETGSMNAEHTALRNPVSGVPAIINQLRCAETAIACTDDGDCGVDQECNRRGFCAADPRVGMGCIPDIYTGLGLWNNFDTFRNVVSLQADPAVTAAAMPTTTRGGTEAVYYATSAVPDRLGMGCVAPMPGVLRGCPGYREDAVRILIQITDADDQCSGCGGHTIASAGAALARENIKFVSLVGTDDDSSGNPETPRTTAEAIGRAAGTVDATGRPYVYDALDAAVVTSTVNAVRELVNGDTFDITIDATDLPDDAGDSLQFIDYLETNTSGVGSCTAIPPAQLADSDDDMHTDMFVGLRPGVPVCWDVIPVAMNSTEMPAREPKMFRARLTVRADGSPVDARDVFFLVPPVVPMPPGID